MAQQLSATHTSDKYDKNLHNFHVHTVHLDIIKVFFIHQLMHK